MNNRLLGRLAALSGVMMLAGTYSRAAGDIAISKLGVKKTSKIQYGSHSFKSGKRSRSQKSRANRRKR